MAAMVATADQNPAASPLKAQQMFDEADAALRRCKCIVPHRWLTKLREEQAMCSPVLATIRHHVRRSPARWQAAIARDGLAERMQQAQQALERHEGTPTCDACGLPSSGLKRCTGCRAARYCSKGCQVAAWPSHKAACKAAQQAAAGSSAGAVRKQRLL